MVACERCRASTEQFDERTASELRLQEVNTNFGVLALLCYQCRKAFSAYVSTHAQMKEYSEASLSLEHWRIKHRRTGNAALSEGLACIRKINEIDDHLNTLVSDWIKAGLGRAERQHRQAMGHPLEDN